MTEAEQDARWLEDFNEVLNGPPPPKESDIQEDETNLNYGSSPTGKVEIVAVIKSLKSPGQENIIAELFKADLKLSADILKQLLTAIWEERKLPVDWTEGVIVKIQRKLPSPITITGMELPCYPSQARYWLRSSSRDWPMQWIRN